MSEAKQVVLVAYTKVTQTLRRVVSSFASKRTSRQQAWSSSDADVETGDCGTVAI